MKRTITINGRLKGTSDHMADIDVEIDARCDKDAFTQLYQNYEHIVRAHYLGGNGTAYVTGAPLNREGTRPWKEDDNE